MFRNRISNNIDIREDEENPDLILTVLDPDNEAAELQVDCEEYLAEDEETVEEEW